MDLFTNFFLKNEKLDLKAAVNEATDLKDLLDEQIVFGYSKIVVDLSQCTYLDSTFIGVLVVATEIITNKRRRVKNSRATISCKRNILT